MKTLLASIAASIGLLLSTTACVSLSGPSYDEFLQRAPALGSEQGRILVFSPAVDVPIVAPKVWLDDVVVGAVPAGGFFFVDRPAGTYRMEMQREALNLNEVLSIDVPVRSGETTYVRFDSFGNSKALTVVTTREGEAGVAACSYYGDETLLGSPGS
jgi:hypothetical protein